VESSKVSKKQLPPFTDNTKAQHGLSCAHKLLKFGEEDAANYCTHADKKEEKLLSQLHLEFLVNR
jgi:hypothetical protein